MIKDKKLEIETLISIVDKNKYTHFIQSNETTIQEILETQKPFFFAVDKFKYFLESTIIGLINSNQFNAFAFNKLLENINEEHGRTFISNKEQQLVLIKEQKDKILVDKLDQYQINILDKDTPSDFYQTNPEKAHSQTFKIFLKSLGLKEDEECELSISENVQNWINKVQSVIDENIKQNNIYNILLYLSGIEFYYAIISKYIEEKVSILPLHCEQNHYKKHATLDLQHGQELLDSATYCNPENNDFGYFYKGVEDFNNLYNEMV